jgi:PPOX class probable FMN-dependent enzyme
MAHNIALSASTAATKCSSQVWRAALKKAMDANKSLPNAKYIQVATTGANASMDDQNDESGFPAIRTVVFRGFLDRDPTKVTFVTDKRSKKVGDFAVNNKCEICWYFPKSREQFRLRGFANVITNESTDEIDIRDRSISWKKMRPGARGQFAWPEPGQPRLPEHEEAYDVDRLIENEDEFENMWPKDKVLENFCLVTVDVNRIDHLKLKGNKRYLYSREQNSEGDTRSNNSANNEEEEKNEWMVCELCP